MFSNCKFKKLSKFQIQTTIPQNKFPQNPPKTHRQRKRQRKGQRQGPQGQALRWRGGQHWREAQNQETQRQEGQKGWWGTLIPNVLFWPIIIFEQIFFLIGTIRVFAFSVNIFALDLSSIDSFIQLIAVFWFGAITLIGLLRPFILFIICNQR